MFHSEFDSEFDCEFEFMFHGEFGFNFDCEFEFMFHGEFDVEFDYEFEFRFHCEFDTSSTSSLTMSLSYCFIVSLTWSSIMSLSFCFIPNLRRSLAAYVSTIPITDTLPQNTLQNQTHSLLPYNRNRAGMRWTILLCLFALGSSSWGVHRNQSTVKIGQRAGNHNAGSAGRGSGVQLGKYKGIPRNSSLPIGEYYFLDFLHAKLLEMLQQRLELFEKNIKIIMVG
ncbi:unnamed protein product [Nesidiocoris tenuis]|uniref:Uncharacterized protein n=1 Tax=Nesidiocoris tenuis TaxID=355587 RepID=A0A6H5FZH8_9HEMI|nr:unnamed protein product [Nesidiocoris tenuis]